MHAVTDDVIQQLQDDQYFALLGDAELAGVSVFRRRTPLPKDGDGNVIVGDTVSIDDKLNEVLAGTAQRDGKNGIAIIVMLPDVKLESIQNAALPMVLKSKLRIVENQLFNESTDGTGITSSQLALHVLQMMQRRSFRGGNPLRADPQKAIEEIPLPGYLVHEVSIDWNVTMPVRDKVADPAMSVSGDELTLTCSTSGARIYYTLDQTFPGRGNEDALLYSAPVTLDPGTYVLRFAAEADDMQASNDLLADLTVS